jgi:hypothetical protein
MGKILVCGNVNETSDTVKKIIALEFHLMRKKLPSKINHPIDNTLNICTIKRNG